MTLTEFLLARITEDEAAGSDAPDSAEWGWWVGVAMTSLCTRLPDTRRVLAECAAKRQIVAIHSGGHACQEPNTGGGSFTDFGSDCVTLGHLASVYADHQDYREEWRP